MDLHRDLDARNPALDLINFLQDPEYLGFTTMHVLNVKLLPFQLAVLKELWSRPFPMFIASRGAGKTFLLAVYSLLRALLTPGAKIVIVGAGFRQAKYVFEYCETIWYNAPIFRDICGARKRAIMAGPKRDTDRCHFRIGDSLIVALPLGDGTKIRGQRANYLIVDEFASIPEEIYEVVVQGFGAVSLSPYEDVERHARLDIMRKRGVDVDAMLEGEPYTGNQSIISGTAYYGFEKFAKYWRRYKAIIESRGDEHILSQIQGWDNQLSWKDFSVIRLPIELIPKGFMDEKNVARSKATIHSGLYNMEYGACFMNDSNGFFQRTLIENCVVGRPSFPVIIDGETIEFSATVRGNSKSNYVFGIDPAAETDNFSIVILEIKDNHRRVVYCWTTTKEIYKKKLLRNLTQEQQFYNYCARKIRDLMKVFPCSHIAMDSQGGGQTGVAEALHDSDLLRQGEKPIWEVINRDKPKDSDNWAGLHILELVNFADAKWVADANHGLKKDFETKSVLFPLFDSLAISYAYSEDMASSNRKPEDDEERVFDTLEDCVFEIESLKEELTTIVHSKTLATGRDKWDTPEIKESTGKKGRLKKDRYSALLMANTAARKAFWTPPEVKRPVIGGLATSAKRSAEGMYVGPEWFMESVRNLG